MFTNLSNCFVAHKVPMIGLKPALIGKINGGKVLRSSVIAKILYRQMQFFAKALQRTSLSSLRF